MSIDVDLSQLASDISDEDISVVRYRYRKRTPENPLVVGVRIGRGPKNQGCCLANRVQAPSLHSGSFDEVYLALKEGHLTWAIDDCRKSRLFFADRKSAVWLVCP